MQRTIFFIFFFIICSVPQQVIYSQGNSIPFDTTTADLYFQQADKLLGEAHYDSSRIYYEKASFIYEKENVWDKYVQCLSKIGKNYTILAHYDSAMKYLEKSLALGVNKFGEKSLAIAHIYNGLGSMHYKLGKLDKALENYQKALSIRLEALGEKNSEVADCYNNIGSVHEYKGDYTRSLHFLRKALSIRLATLGEKHRDIARSYRGIGNIYRFTVNKDSALVYLQKALSISRAALGEMHPDVAICYSYIGVIYYEKNDYDKALEYSQKGLLIDLKVFGEKNQSVGTTYHMIGNIYSTKGDNIRAFEYHQKALSIYLEIFGEQHPFVAYGYYEIGRCYVNKGDYEKALLFFQKSITMNLMFLGEKHPNIAICYDEIGNIHSVKGEYDKALQYYQKSLAINLAELGEMHSNVAQNYSKIGNVYSAKGDYDKALQFNQKSLAIIHAKFSEKHSDVAFVYQNMGLVFFKQKKPFKALEYYQRSIISLVLGFNETNIYANPALKKIIKDPYLLNSLEYKAAALEKLYLKSKNLMDLLCAESTYELASRLINKMKCNYQSEGSKLDLGEQSSRIYNKAISTSLRLYEITHKKEHEEKALAFSERSKVSVLLQSLSESKAKQFAGIPGDLLQKERDFKIDLAFYEKNLFEEQAKGKKTSQSKITFYQDKLFNLNRQYEALTNHIEREYPEYYTLKYKTSTISPQEIQAKLLNKNNALVEYFTGDSVIYIFTLTKYTFNVTTIKKDTLFDGQIKSMREGLIKRKYDLYADNAYRLYQRLIEPIKTTIASKNLIIIPDGILGYIPFETLLTQQPDSQKKDYRQLAYLINDNQITYDYSATLLLENATKGKLKSESHYVGFAPVTFK